jgi:phospholipid transport system substrate-binding protein
MTVATYASNFKSYDGERFVVDPNVETRGANRVVRTRLIPNGKDPVSLSYLMRQAGSTWKAIDVYYLNTISQLAARRSEFSGILRSGGADALQQKLRELGDRLLAGG